MPALKRLGIAGKWTAVLGTLPPAHRGREKFVGKNAYRFGSSGKTARPRDRQFPQLEPVVSSTIAAAEQE